MERRIVSTTILVEWSDGPKPVVLNNDMPNGLANWYKLGRLNKIK